MDPPHNPVAAKVNWRTLIAFWILGLTNNYGYVVMLSAANDILHDAKIPETMFANQTSTQRECNYISTGAILLADILPIMLIKAIAPFLPFFIHIRVIMCICFLTSGFLIVAFSTKQWLSILGVVVTSFATGLGESSYLQYISFFSIDAVSTWSSGTGAAGIFGALSYTILRRLGFRTALLIMLILPFLMIVGFWLLLPNPNRSQNIIIQINVNEDEIEDTKTMLIKKIKTIPSLLKYIIPFGGAYLFEYFINQGTFELMNFENIFINRYEQYRWLQVSYQIGVFISRSSINLLYVKKIWILSLLQLLNVFVYIFEVMYYYMPTFWIILAFTLWEGLLSGGVYVNTFYKIQKEVPEENKQFAMSCTSAVDGITISLAGVLAILAHNKICDLPKPIRLNW